MLSLHEIALNRVSNYITSTLIGLLLSVIILYMLSIVTVVWDPASYDPSDTKKTEMLRMESAITANTTMLSIIIVLLLSRGFSLLGENLVDLLLKVLLSDDEDDPTIPSTFHYRHHNTAPAVPPIPNDMRTVPIQPKANRHDFSNI